VNYGEGQGNSVRGKLTGIAAHFIAVLLMAASAIIPVILALSTVLVLTDGPADVGCVVIPEDGSAEVRREVAPLD